MLEDLEQLNPVDNGKAMTVQAHQEDEPMIGGAFSLPMTFFSTFDVAPGWDYADRDAWLRVFWKKFGGDLLQAVLATSVAKVQTQNFTFEGPEKMATFYHDAFVPEADFGKGYSYMVARGVIDYYTQDNGWFLERHRSGPNDNDGPCLGLAHLDSHRMKPTGNAETPWAYLDVDGVYHLMHKSQFIRIVDMPTPEVEKHGWERGFCALSRALSTAMVMTMLVAMKREKLADLPPSALAVFNNISRKQFESALSLHSLQEEAKGNQVWRSLLPLFGIDPAHPAGVDFISLREVWEGFDELTAYNVAAYSIAAAWRMDPREFWPVSQGPLGTGKEAEVQHQKAKAKSTGLLFTEIERAFNSKYTLPRELTFKYALQDSDEEEQQARIHQMQITNIKAMQEAGAELNSEEVRYLLSSQYKVLPKGMEKPVEEGGSFSVGADTTVWMDDVDRQTKEFWGSSVIIDQNGKVIRLEKGYRSVSVPFGLKGGPGSGNRGHAGRPGKIGGSAPKAAAGPSINLVILPGAGVGGKKAYGVIRDDGTKIIADRTGDELEAARQAGRISTVLDELPAKHVAGIVRIDAHAGGLPIGAMGYVGRLDEIWVTDVGRGKTDSAYRNSLIHEIGHRVQLKSDPGLFRDFKKSGFGTTGTFKGLATSAGWGEFTKNYKKKTHAGEAFAESYAWFFTRNKQLLQEFPDIHAFWDDRLG